MGNGTDQHIPEFRRVTFFVIYEQDEHTTVEREFLTEAEARSFYKTVDTFATFIRSERLP